MKHYEDKFDYLAERQKWVCPIWREHARKDGRFATDHLPTELHHRLHNTKPNRRRFPALIDSLLNLAAVNHAWHMKYPFWGRINLATADKMERALERWPKARAFVTGESKTLNWRTQ